MAQAIDPVCGMTVDSDTAAFSTEYQGQTIYFCAPCCKRTFEKEPAKYIQQTQEQQGQHQEHHQ